MLMHYAGEAVPQLLYNQLSHPPFCDYRVSPVGLTENDNFAETKRKLTEYFRPQCNEECEIFKFRQTEQMAA